MHTNIRRENSLSIACIGGIGCLATALFVLPALAGTNSWTEIGPVAYPFAVDPSSPSTIYSVVNRNSVIDPSPSSPKTVFPIGGNTVTKTTDGGAHWADLTVLTDEVNSLVIDPRSSATIYAAAGDAWDSPSAPIYESIDGGAHWVAEAYFNNLSASVVAIAPSSSSTLYAGAQEEVFKSVDGGLSWAMPGNLPYGFGGFYVSALDIDPTNADVVFIAQTVAGFASGPDTAKIFKSTDGGGQWREIPIPVPPPVAIRSLAIDPATPSIVYAAYGSFLAGKGGVLKSIDGGATWTAAQSGLPDTIFINALAIDPGAPARIYAATDQGVFRSTDGAASWTPINSGLTNLHVWSLSIDGTGSLLRAATGAGLFEYLATPAEAPVQTAVEYGFRSVWDYGYSSYFVTSSPDEIAALDRGALDTASGLIWERTGETFDVWTVPADGALPTCRFFYAASVDHFYTPYAAECAAVQARPEWHWQYEGIAFYLQVPDGNGNCPLGTAILYRLYNNGMFGAPAHRYTTSAATFSAMLAEGWVFEGDARTFAFACVPSSSPPSTP